MNSKITRRTFLRGVAAAAAGSLVAACTPKVVEEAATAVPTATAVPPTKAAATATAVPPTATPSFKTGGIYYQAHGAYDDYCDFTGGNIQELSALLGDSLVAWTPACDEIIPALAEGWEAAPDGLSYTFYLRKGVKWSDGVDFDGRDVAWTLSTCANGETAGGGGRASYLTLVEGFTESSENNAKDLAGVKLVDNFTVRIEFSAPDPLFIKKLGYITMEPEHVLGEVPRAELRAHPFWTTDQRVGTGAFKFSKLVPEQRVELVANELHWRGKPLLDGVTHVFFSDASAQQAAFETGDIQYIGIGIPDIDRMQALPHTTVVSASYWLYRNFIVNHKHGLLGDKRWRQAVAYAIDRDTIIQQFFKGQVVPQYGPWLQKEYQSPDENHYDYDPEKAKALLEEIGWDSSTEVGLISRSNEGDILAAFQAYLGEVGIKIKAENVDRTVWAQVTWDEETYDLAFGHLGNPNDPVQNAPSFRCNDKWPAGMNVSNYCNPRVDELFKLAAVEMDPKARTVQLQELDLILNDELPHIPMFDTRMVVAVDSRVVGRAEAVGPTFVPYYYASHLWWLNM